jgi:spermidine synthase
MDITRTKHGLRMSQHGVVISELRTSPGPTHSVSDLLAAIISVMRPEGRIGVLGFAGGGMQAPLSALGVMARIDTVDLDRAGYELFRTHCPAWIARVNWQQADAVKWLRAQPKHFDLVVEDLSVPDGDDVFKPSISWDVLPALIRDRLAPDGVAVFNLLPPPSGIWVRQVERMADLFGEGRIVAFDDFENHILVAGRRLPSARELGVHLRSLLRQIRSRQAERIHVRTVRASADRAAR